MKHFEVGRTCLLITQPGKVKDHLARRCEGSKKKEEGGKAKSDSGQDWTLQSHRGPWKTHRDGGSWLRDHQWCPYDPLGQGIVLKKNNLHTTVALDTQLFSSFSLTFIYI